MSIRFYHYYFVDMKDPVIIQANNKHESREILINDALPLLPDYQDKNIIAETTSMPIVGITKRVIGGKKMIWIGMEAEGNKKGWKEEEQSNKSNGSK